MHKVKVYRAPSPTVVPQIRLQGNWVEQAGFHIGDTIRVEACYGEIKISLDHNDFTSETVSEFTAEQRYSIRETWRQLR